MSAGPQKAHVFARFRWKTSISPAAAARPAQKCRVFTCHLMPPSDKAKRTGFRGCSAARKPRFFTGREHNGRKTTCFCGPTRPPLADPSPAGGAGPGCATPRENASFRIKNVVLPRRQALRGAKTQCSPCPPLHPAGPSRAGRRPIRPACARDSAHPAQIHRVLPRELARSEPGPGTGPSARRNTGVAPGTGQNACVFAGAAPPDKRVEPAQ